MTEEHRQKQRRAVFESSLIYRRGSRTVFPHRVIDKRQMSQKKVWFCDSYNRDGPSSVTGWGRWLIPRLSYQPGRKGSPLLSLMTSTLPEGKQRGPSGRALIWFTEVTAPEKGLLQGMLWTDGPYFQICRCLSTRTHSVDLGELGSRCGTRAGEDWELL